MIRRLRRRHLAWSWLLAGGSAVALSSAILAPVATHRSNPEISGRQRAHAAGAAGPALAIANRIVGAHGPDLLVYYTTAAAADTLRLPNDARFLGPFNRHPNALAALIEPVASRPGTIIVWSGPHHRIVMATEIATPQ